MHLKERYIASVAVLFTGIISFVGLSVAFLNTQITQYIPYFSDQSNTTLAVAAGNSCQHIVSAKKNEHQLLFVNCGGFLH